MRHALKTLALICAAALMLAPVAEAQVPVSGLPSATTPLSGAELLPCVQSSVTKKCTVSNLQISPPNCTLVSGLQTGGTLDNTAALNAAFAALPAKGGCLSFPAGLYAFNSAVTYSFSTYPAGVTIQGAGTGATTLLWPNATNGLTFNLKDATDSVALQGLALATGQVSTSTTALTIQNSNPIISGTPAGQVVRDVFLTGWPVYSSNYWGVGLQTNAVGQLYADNLSEVGVYPGATGATGVQLGVAPLTATTNAATATSSNVLHFASVPSGLTVGMYVYDTTNIAAVDALGVTAISGGDVTLNSNVAATVNSGDAFQFNTVSVIFQFNNLDLSYLDTGVKIWGGVQGVNIYGSNIGANNGIVVPSGQYGLDQLTLVNSQLASSKSIVSVQSNFFDTLIAHNAMYPGDNTGSYPAISLPNTSRATISGNNIVNSNTAGSSVGISFGGEGAAISGNLIQGFSAGVSLLSGSSHVATDVSNTFIGTTTNYSSLGTANVAIYQDAANNLRLLNPCLTCTTNFRNSADGANLMTLDNSGVIHFSSYSNGTLKVDGSGQLSAAPVAHPLMFSGCATAQAASITDYYGSGTCGTTFNVPNLIIAPQAGSLGNLYVSSSNVPGAGQTYTATLYYNNAGTPTSTGITCTISGASASACSDTTHTFAIAAGTGLTLQVVSSGGAGTTNFGWGFTLSN